MSIRVQGCSDDIVFVGGDVTEEFDALNAMTDGRTGGYLTTSNGVVLRIEFSSDGVWEITRVVDGAGYEIHKSSSKTSDSYTDVAEIAGVIEWVTFGKDFAKK